MRAVARHLDVAPMTVYGYVANKEALHALVIDRILSQVRVPEPDERPWEQRLRHLVCDARRILIDVCFVALFTYVTGNVDPTNTSVADEAPTPIRKAAGRPRSDHFRLGLQALIEGLKQTLVLAA